MVSRDINPGPISSKPRLQWTKETDQLKQYLQMEEVEPGITDGSDCRLYLFP